MSNPALSNPNTSGHPESRVVASSFKRRIGNAALDDAETSTIVPIREAIRKRLDGVDDRGRRLPFIKYFRSGIERDGSTEQQGITLLDDQGERTGRAQVTRDLDDKAEFFSGVLVNGKNGYGTRLYLEMALEAVERGHDFRSDPLCVTPAAVGMWHKLASEGIAQAIDEFTLIDRTTDLYAGYYVINGNDLPKVSEV